MRANNTILLPIISINVESTDPKAKKVKQLLWDRTKLPYHPFMWFPELTSAPCFTSSSIRSSFPKAAASRNRSSRSPLPFMLPEIYLSGSHINFWVQNCQWKLKERITDDRKRESHEKHNQCKLQVHHLIRKWQKIRSGVDWRTCYTKKM